MYLYSHIAHGYRGLGIRIEADVHNGFPGFDIVGLPDSTIKESRERIRSAVHNQGFKFPSQHILINLAPANLQKTGSSLDAAIALSLLLATHPDIQKYQQAIPVMATGELSLQGLVKGDFSLSALYCAKESHCKLLVTPDEKNAADLYSPLVSNVVDTSVQVRTIHTLREAYTCALEVISSYKVAIPLNPLPTEQKDSSLIREHPYAGIYGMKDAKRALEIAAAGRHNILFFGPSGAGKTLLATRLGIILPPLGVQERTERLFIHEAAKQPLSSEKTLLVHLPHDVTSRNIMGNYQKNLPGMAALYHAQTLFLDELTSYSRHALETIKEIQDEASILLNPVAGSYLYPSRFNIVATMNACPCGHLGMEGIRCLCSDKEIKQFWKKIPAPFLDRFDIRVPVLPENIEDTTNKAELTPPLEKIAHAARLQEQRYNPLDAIHRNGDMVHSITGKSHALTIFKSLLERLHSFHDIATQSARTILSIASVAQTIGDMENNGEVTDKALAEAVQLHQYGNTDIFWRELS